MNTFQLKGFKEGLTKESSAFKTVQKVVNSVKSKAKNAKNAYSDGRQGVQNLSQKGKSYAAGNFAGKNRDALLAGGGVATLGTGAAGAYALSGSDKEKKASLAQKAVSNMIKND